MFKILHNNIVETVASFKTQEHNFEQLPLFSFQNIFFVKERIVFPYAYTTI